MLKHNTQYGIDPYCFTPNVCIYTCAAPYLTLQLNKTLKYDTLFLVLATAYSYMAI